MPTSMAIVIMLRVLWSRPGRAQMPPQAYSIKKSWNSALKGGPVLGGARGVRRPEHGLTDLLAALVAVLAHVLLSLSDDLVAGRDLAPGFLSVFQALLPRKMRAHMPPARSVTDRGIK